MAATQARPRAQEANGGGMLDSVEDPFARPLGEPRRASHRYSAFDLHAFAQNQPAESPSSAKRALEAHLSETDRRLEDASRLGTALVQQRGKIAERLKEVEQLQNEREIGPELKQKLVDVEKEYHELGRDSARVSMAPKGQPTSADEAAEGQMGLSGVRALWWLVATV